VAWIRPPLQGLDHFGVVTQGDALGLLGSHRWCWEEIGELGQEGDDMEPGQLVRQCRTNCRRRDQLVSRPLTVPGRREQLGSGLLPNLRGSNLCSRLLPKLAGRAVFSEKLHVFEVSRRESLHVRECGAKVSGELVNDLGSPAFPALTFEDVATDVVVEADLLRIGGEKRALSGSLNAGFQAGKPVAVIGG
jgi:hypothetical protein